MWINIGKAGDCSPEEGVSSPIIITASGCSEVIGNRCCLY